MRLRNFANDNLLFGFLLFVVTAIVFWPACYNSFLEWDDLDYVFREPHVLNGITADGLTWVLTANVGQNWHPVTMFSLQLDAQLFGSDAFGFHRSAVLLHSLNAVMVFWMLVRLTGQNLKSAIVAGLFALHPLRVESVAWISERKDLLSGFFFCLTILAYVRYAKNPSIMNYLMMACSLFLGLASKSMLVTLPCVLVLLDYWPLGRFRSLERAEWPQLGKILLEKAPLLAISVLFSCVTMWVQKGARKSWPLDERITNAVVSLVVYLRQTILPYGLSTFYGRREIRSQELLVAVSLLILISMVAFIQRRQRPYLLVGWLWYLGMLVPVIGLIQVGKQIHADRYTYLPQMGVLIALVWLGVDLAQGARWRAGVLTGALCLFFGLCVPATRQQIQAWRDTEALWEHAIQLDPDDKFPIRNLMMHYFRFGKKEKAVKMAQEMVRSSNFLEPTDVIPMIDSATYLSDAGMHEQSLELYDKLAEAFPENGQIVVNRGKEKAAQSDWSGAAEDYRRAARIAPEKEAFQFYLAHALAKAGDQVQAQSVLRKAVNAAPGWPKTAADLAYQLTTHETAPACFWAICLAEQANMATEESDVRTLDVLAISYANAGRFEEAVLTQRKAILAAERSGQAKLEEELRSRLRLFESGLPYRPKNLR